MQSYDIQPRPPWGLNSTGGRSVRLRDAEPIVPMQSAAGLTIWNGKGWSLAPWLTGQGVRTLLVAGCVTSGCVRASVVDAMCWGFRPVVLADCVGSYFPEFQRIGLEMVAAQGGIFGWVTTSTDFLAALTPINASH